MSVRVEDAMLTWSDEQLRIETLLLAVEQGNEEVIKTVLDEGTRIINKRIEGPTCLIMAALHAATLHWVAPKRHVRIVEYLINKGAKVNFPIYDLEASPLHCIADMGVFTILPYYTTSKPLTQEMFEDSVSIIEILLKKGASVDVRDVYGRTPLHYAVGVEEFQPEVVRCLLDHGADVNAKTKRGRTPIMYTKNENILRLLIQRGANVNHISRKYFTALSRAIKLKRPALVDVLLESGADMNLKNSDGNTVLEIHKKWNSEILEAVVNKARHFTILTIYTLQERNDKSNMIPLMAKRQANGEIDFNVEAFTRNYTRQKYRQSEMEILKMRNTKIEHLDFSLFDILVMPANKLMDYVEKKEIGQLYDSDLEKDVPLYAKMIRKNIEKALDRRYLIEESVATFKKLIFSYQKIKLPDLVVYEIIPFLHYLDLTNLVQIKQDL